MLITVNLLDNVLYSEAALPVFLAIRSLIAEYQNAMTIVFKYGKPDIFMSLLATQVGKRSR